ncbi:ferric reductase NAD binding domain-containing protein [Pseudomassariella vexata]|uniref:Ferric reductase NAD binding domain-domain-containing protein n=1 Tax=Pseudomassariella vexata TaxID=1141098 RepID=A0A1Y2EBN9_9PEZI|nr:ferric reductase NAD binding domain-containing protein [Pseudomassariella vexata]ORY68980.1 ferric reductase NAD binding domain-domain-containing protein [Pseudomassariella vexata]
MLQVKQCTEIATVWLCNLQSQVRSSTYPYQDLTTPQAHFILKPVAMMEWPFHFQPANPASPDVISQYALIAQVSSCVPLILLAAWSRRRNLHDMFNLSPKCKYQTVPKHGYSSSSLPRRIMHTVLWWLGCRAGRLDGTVFQWFMGLSWAVWLSIICLCNTSSALSIDYLHLTKRIGAVASSQLPMTVLLAVKSSHSPVQKLLGISERHLNIYHRILARIAIALALCHVMLYLNFYVKSGLVSKRIRDSDVLLGLAGTFSLAVIAVTSARFVRSWNYRFFFLNHVAGVTLALIFIFFHTNHARLFASESLIIYLVSIVARIRCTKTLAAKLEMTPSSDVVVTLQLDGDSHYLPDASHVYIGKTSGGNFLLAFFKNYLRRNPFTVFRGPADKDMLLLIRPQKGQTSVLRSMAKTCDVGQEFELVVEGPYGPAVHSAPSLPSHLRASYDNLFLVAAGSGASFIMPIFSKIVTEYEAAPAETPRCRIQLILVVKTRTELDTVLRLFCDEKLTREVPTLEASLHNFMKIFLTQPSQNSTRGEDVELGDLVQDEDADDLITVAPGEYKNIATGRPNWEEVVDVFFDGGDIQGSTTAVVSCGPEMLQEAVRSACAPWVRRGADIEWYEEGFS